MKAFANAVSVTPAKAGAPLLLSQVGRSGAPAFAGVTKGWRMTAWNGTAR